MPRAELVALIPGDHLYIGAEHGSEFALNGVEGLKTILRALVGSSEAYSDVNYQGDGVSNSPIWRRDK